MEILLPAISKPLLNDYNFTYHNVTSFDDAIFYLHGEKHSSQACRVLGGMVISRLASRYPVIVLIEGSPSMKKIVDNVEDLMRAYCIPLRFIENITFIGCDAENLDQEMGCSPGLYSFLIEQDKDCKSRRKQLGEALDAICPNLENLTEYQLWELESEDL